MYKYRFKPRTRTRSELYQYFENLLFDTQEPFYEEVDYPVTEKCYDPAINDDEELPME